MAKKVESTVVEIKPPNFKVLAVTIRGTAPLMIHKFSTKVAGAIEAKQTATDKVSKKRPPKDYEAEFNGARYTSEDGWDGFYAGALRMSMIAAIRFTSGLTMVQARGVLFVQADGFDESDGTPLIRIKGCEAKHDKRAVRLASGGTDMRNRPRYDRWYADVNIQYDADIMSESDVTNLLARAGVSVGLCEGRPMSKDSAGLGFGTFSVHTTLSAVNKRVAS